MARFSDFVRGYGLGRQMVHDYEAARDREKMAEIAQAKPEESKGFTAEQGDQLRAAADSGQYDIGFDPARGGYTVTPKAGGETGVVAQQGVTDFLGARTAGDMAPRQVDDARTSAMAGVIARTNPVGAMRMQREITQGQRDDQRFGWERARAEREQRTAAQQESDALAARELDADVGQWFQGRLAGPDGAARAATVDDHLAATQYRAAKLAQAGKMDAAGQVMRDFNAQSLVKIQLQTAQREQALGKTAASLAAGDLGAVRDFYNEFVPDGARVTDVKRNEKGEILIQRETLDGRPMPATTMKDTGQVLAALSSFKDPMALYTWSQSELRNTLAQNADKRADEGMVLQQNADRRAANADARAASSHAASVAERGVARGEKSARADAAVALFKENNPNATPAQLAAVRTGILGAVPETDKGAPAEVKLAQAYRRAGLASTDAEALRMATSSKADSPEKVRAEIYGKALAANLGDAKRAREATEDAMGYLFPAPAPAAATKTAAAPAPKKGDVIQGYEYLGGDPKSEKSWRPAAK